MNMNVKERFLRYVAYPTMSDERNESCPSTEKQWALARCLSEELCALGLNVSLSEHGYVYAYLAANTETPMPKIGLIAHMDVSDACPDAPISPEEVLYNGEDIILNEEQGIVLSERDYANLGRYRGKHLIVTDGTTLLGGDDKAGIAEIVCAVERLITGGIKHGPVRVAFTPDEEIGRGADLFDTVGFDADYAYTVDGGTLGGISYENFNAASAEIVIHGCSAHPGDAKGKMINASRLACEIHTLLPADEIPEKTELYEGFFHLTDMQGDCEYARIRYIIRDHDKEKFAERKEAMRRAVAAVNDTWGGTFAMLHMEESYYNMKETMTDKTEIIERAAHAMRACGAEPEFLPIRGGTDGARLSYEGLPCPNLSTGCENGHSRFEFACVEDMETMVSVLVTLLCAENT